jgi:hypothetical protein
MMPNAGVRSRSYIARRELPLTDVGIKLTAGRLQS